MSLTRLTSIPELVVHCLSYLAPLKYDDTSVRTLVACMEACRSLAEIAKTDLLWGPHYQVRYLRGQGVEGEWYNRYVSRRKSDVHAISLLNDIISTPSKRDESIVQLVEMGDLAWDILNMEAMCRVPDELRDIWAKEDRERREERWEGIGEEWNDSAGQVSDKSSEEPDSRGIKNDWIQRRWWARQALGTMSRASAVHTMSKIFSDDRPDPASLENARVFEEGIKALSGLMGANVAEITHNYNNLARACGLHLESVGVSTNPQSPGFDLEAFSVGVCNWMASQGFKQPEGDHYYDLMNHFPHKFMTTNRRALPLSLVYTFVAIVTRLGLRAAPVAFPGHVHAWIALPDSGEDRSLAVDVFRSDDEDPLMQKEMLRDTLRVLNVPESQMGALLGPAPAAEMVFRAANNILHSVTLVRAQTQVDTSVSPETRAAALYASATTFLIARPEAAGASRFIDGVTSAVKEYFPLDTEPVLARALYQRLTRDPHQTVGFLLRHVADRLKQDYVEVNGRGPVQWWVGLVFRHRKHGYMGLVTGWDQKCKADEEWIQAMGVSQLSRGRDQPFYTVLGEDGSTRYVAEENIVPLPTIPEDGEEQDRVTWANVHELVANSTGSIEQTFSRIEFDEEHGSAWFVPGANLAREYPGDIIVGQAYMWNV